MKKRKSNYILIAVLVTALIITSLYLTLNTFVTSDWELSATRLSSAGNCYPNTNYQCGSQGSSLTDNKIGVSTGAGDYDYSSEARAVYKPVILEGAIITFDGTYSAKATCGELGCGHFCKSSTYIQLNGGNVWGASPDLRLSADKTAEVKLIISGSKTDVYENNQFITSVGTGGNTTLSLISKTSRQGSQAYACGSSLSIQNLVIAYDTDKDGIINDIDLCLNTKEKEVVNSEGCSVFEIDSDQDGVIDLYDKCREVKGTDADGCTQQTAVEKVTEKVTTVFTPVKEIKEVTETVTPLDQPFYEQAWFYIVSALVVIIIIFLILVKRK